MLLHAARPLRVGLQGITMRLMRQQHQARRRAMALERRIEALRLQRVRTSVIVVLRHGGVLGLDARHKVLHAEEAKACATERWLTIDRLFLGMQGFAHLPMHQQQRLLDFVGLRQPANTALLVALQASLPRSAPPLKPYSLSKATTRRRMKHSHGTQTLVCM